MIKDVILCKDCRYFEENLWSNLFGSPIIVAHNICCRDHENKIAVQPEGFCFLAQPLTEKAE